MHVLVKEAPVGAGDVVPSEETIQAWLVGRLAERLGVAETEVDVSQPFAFYGLDSLAAVSLSAELEDRLGRKLPPTLTWDYPTVVLLSRHLAETVTPAAVA
jgi:acyl carrier protein